ncbi:hypothetical protein J6590_078423 [Homalodisca vitripennis]|nr:hypothetical protein J6590_078423 [Homalodisca vitripennis]
MEFEECFEFYNDVAVGENLTDEDILASVQPSNPQEDEAAEDDEEEARAEMTYGMEEMVPNLYQKASQRSMINELPQHKEHTSATAFVLATALHYITIPCYLTVAVWLLPKAEPSVSRIDFARGSKRELTGRTFYIVLTPETPPLQ